jgi:hypothetical protein
MFESTPLAPDATVNDHRNAHPRDRGTQPHSSLGWDRASGEALAAHRAQKGGSPVKQVTPTG